MGPILQKSGWPRFIDKGKEEATEQWFKLLPQINNAKPLIPPSLELKVSFLGYELKYSSNNYYPKRELWCLRQQWVGVMGHRRWEDVKEWADRNVRALER